MSIHQYLLCVFSTAWTAFPITSLLLLTSAVAPAPAQDCSSLNPANLTIQSSLFPSLPGQAVTFTGFIEGATGVPDPTGTIQLMDGQVDLGTFEIKLGQVSTTKVFSEAGTRSIYAIYSGDSNYCLAIVRFGQVVNRFVTTIGVAASAATSVYGQGVTFKVQMSPTPPAGVASPTGQVEFFEGSTDLGGVALTAGAASFTLANLVAGSHLITAVYGGDTNYYLVRSAPLGLTVSRAQTGTALSATANSGQAMLLAIVSVSPPGAGIPDGAVQFVDTTANTVLGTIGLQVSESSALPTGLTPIARIAISAAQFSGAAGHSIAATYQGDSNFVASTSNAISVPALVNATGAPSVSFAAEELVSLFGSNLANTTLQSGSPPLPTSLGGYGVTVTDSAGAVRSAGLYLVSPGQINFVIPAGTAPGAALVTVANTSAGVGVGSGAIPIQIAIGSVAPGLFSANANGKGLAAAQIVRVHPDGTQSLENVSATPINIGPDTLYLVLYASGLRNRSSPSNVICTINGQSLPVTYAGPQTQYPGLDQVDVLVPQSFKGAGQVNTAVTVDGQMSNTVTLAFQ